MPGPIRRARRRITEPSCGCASAKVREHREHPPVVVRRRQEPELQEDRVDVGLDGLRAEESRSQIARLDRPSAIRPSTSRSRAVSSSSGSSARVGRELRDDVGVDDGAAVSRRGGRVEELVELHDAVLEQVAEALGDVARRASARSRASTTCESTSTPTSGCSARIVAAALALVGMGRRHADVDDRDVGLARLDRSQQLIGVAGLADDLEARRPRGGGQCPRGGARSRRRSRPARDLRLQRVVPVAGRALDREATAERLDAVAEPAQARAAVRARRRRRRRRPRRRACRSRSRR